MKLLFVSLMLVGSLFSKDITVTPQGNIVLTPTEYIKLTHNRDISVSQYPTQQIQTPKNDIIFSVTKSNLSIVIEIFVLIFAIVGGWFAIKGRLTKVEENCNNMKSTVANHEERIKVNEEKQTHYATKEAVESDLKSKEMITEFLGALGNTVKNGENNG